jgi:hypothetical protein
VLRLAAAQAVAAGDLRGRRGGLALAAEAALVKDFLGGDYARLDALRARGCARGRRGAARSTTIVDDAAVRRELAADVAGFAGSLRRAELRPRACARSSSSAPSSTPSSPADRRRQATP